MSRPRSPEAHAEYMRRWYERHPEKREANRQLQARHQARTGERAHRNGAEWTSAELEYVVTDELTAYEVAEMLGRTYRAVLTKRHQLRRSAETVASATV